MPEPSTMSSHFSPVGLLSLLGMNFLATLFWLKIWSYSTRTLPPLIMLYPGFTNHCLARLLSFTVTILSLSVFSPFRSSIGFLLFSTPHTAYKQLVRWKASTLKTLHTYVRYKEVYHNIVMPPNFLQRGPSHWGLSDVT